MESMARFIIGVGVVLVLVGGVMLLLGKLGINLGNLPGDIHAEGERSSFHFPVVTCIVVSVVLTVLANVVLRLWK
jgi:hypothetical protein